MNPWRDVSSLPRRFEHESERAKLEGYMNDGSASLISHGLEGVVAVQRRRASLQIREV